MREGDGWDPAGRTRIDGGAEPVDASRRTLISTHAPLFEDQATPTLVGSQPTASPLGAGTASPNAVSARSSGHESVELEAGMRMGQFELIRELGRGGMGQVFLARDTKLGRLVALKFLSLRAPHLIARFLVEARATAQCHHENIVVIYEAGESGGLPYMALEYLEGQPLAALLDGHPLPTRRVVELMVPVARALERAHELGIVHRDLKPDNIFVTRGGQVKVLDFGIAKLFGHDETARRIGARQAGQITSDNKTQAGAIVGTMPYMSPEQWGTDEVDHRTDLWAVGIILWKMLTGRHPVEPTTPARLRAMAALLDEPMPRIEQLAPTVPAELARVVDRCLLKSKHQRLSSAAELLAAIEGLVPGRYGRRLGVEDCPFPGMAAFQESDADRFFGRARDIDQMVQRMREQPLVGVVGPSGIGKSSFVRAGVVPALRSSEDAWEVLLTRPGRDPLGALAALLQSLTGIGDTDLHSRVLEHATLVARLRSEPGFLGTLLRSRARQKQGRVLLFVDQFEELYTLVEDATLRHAYTACLAGVADDPSTPLRVVVSMRSDLLDRAAEDRAFMDRLGAGLIFLPAIDREGIREALTEPLEMVGHRFESQSIVEEMLDALDGTSGALPLLQFTAAKLWDQRDRSARLLTMNSYRALGGVGGALATHADELLASMAPQQQRLTRAVFQRLVTTEGTRALADVEELEQLASGASEMRAVLDQLVSARLLVVHGRGDEPGAAVEMVHESLIHSWPTLRRWREQSADDSTFLEQLRTAAKQWVSAGRPQGLLWRGEAMDEARRFHRRFKGDIPNREREYLDAVVSLAMRSASRRRRLVAGAFAVMAALVVAAAIALIWIRDAEQAAQRQRQLAESETERARDAEAEVRSQLATIQEHLRTIQAQKATIKDTEAKREEATQQAQLATEKAKTAESERKLTYEQLEEALSHANRERARAEEQRQRAEEMAAQNQRLAESERKAKEQAEKLNGERQARIRALENELSKLGTKLD